MGGPWYEWSIGTGVGWTGGTSLATALLLFLDFYVLPIFCVGCTSQASLGSSGT